MNERDFEFMCDTFEMEIEGAESSQFAYPDGKSVALGNGDWFVELYCKDEDIHDPKFPLLQLVRNRKDLLYGVLTSKNFADYIRNSHALAVWLDRYGYVISLGSHNFWGRFRIWSFNKFVDLYSRFS